MSVRFGFVPVVPPFVGAHQEESVVTRYAEALVAMGGERWSPEDLTGDAPLVYLIATGGTEGVMLSLRAAREATVRGEPALLIAHPGNNSLPASLEVLARLQQDGTAGRILYLSGPDDPDGLARVASAIEDLAVAHELRSLRLGLVGDPSDWLVASMPGAGTVRDAWGPEVVSIPMDELLDRMDAVSEDDAATAAQAFAEGSTACLEPTPADLLAVARVHAALKALVDEHQLDAVTVRCFDVVLERGTSGCFALAELTDSGVIAGCEGDLVSTVGMLWTARLLGELPWMANPAQVDESANALWLAHCTVPRGLVERYRLRSHFESGAGVGIQGSLPIGPVTLVRIGGRDMQRLWLAEGEVTKTGDAEDLCRTQAFVRLTSGHVSELLRAPLGNHIVLVRGHHAARLRAWWELMV